VTTVRFPLRELPIEILEITSLRRCYQAVEKKHLQQDHPDWWQEFQGVIDIYNFKFEIWIRIPGGQHSSDYPGLAQRISDDFQELLSFCQCSSGDFRESLLETGENMAHLVEAVFRAAYLFVLYEIGRKIGEKILFQCLKERDSQRPDVYQLTIYQNRDLSHSFIIDLVDLVITSYLSCAIRGLPYDILPRLREKIDQYTPRDDFQPESQPNRQLCPV